MTKPVRWAVGVTLLLVSAWALRAGAQTIKYARGQNVAPIFEGWERNLDGTFSMYFGYLNRNYEEELDTPIGSNNTIDPGGDRGQPTHFYTRRQRFLFKVTVPNDWDKTRKVVWTLTAHGQTAMGKGWLQPEWEIDQGIISENNGGGVFVAGNKPPTITGSSAQTVTWPNPVTLTAKAIDDGIPKPRKRPPLNPDQLLDLDPDSPIRRTDGMRITWIHYRGPGKVTFDPPGTKPVHGQPVEMTTKVSFSEPGAYVVRAIANDSQLSATHDVTITVNPMSTQNR